MVGCASHPSYTGSRNRKITVQGHQGTLFEKYINDKEFVRVLFFKV
jgi:hypothetical protein